jgi:hypothetical protein
LHLPLKALSCGFQGGNRPLRLLVNNSSGKCLDFIASLYFYNRFSISWMHLELIISPSVLLHFTSFCRMVGGLSNVVFLSGLAVILSLGIHQVNPSHGMS